MGNFCIFECHFLIFKNTQKLVSFSLSITLQIDIFVSFLQISKIKRIVDKLG